MTFHLTTRRPRSRIAAAVLGAILASLAVPAAATRVGGASGAAPAASDVRAAPQQPPQQQADESASLRQGTIARVDAARRASAGARRLARRSSPARTQLCAAASRPALDTLKAGEAIRFTVVADPGAAPTIKVIYAP